MTREDPLFGDLKGLPPHVRRPATVGRWIFGVCGAVGAIALILHAIVFYIAWHYAVRLPGGDQIYRISEHGYSVYVSYVVHETLRILSVIMFAGLGVGVPGGLLVDYLVKRHQRRRGSVQRLQ